MALIANQPVADRSRILWGGFTWLLSAAFVVIGLIYLIGGNEAQPALDNYAAVVRWAGGMRVHGAVMVLVGLVLVFGLIAPFYRVETARGPQRLPMRESYLRRWALPISIGYGSLMVLSFIGSWAITATPAAVAITWRVVLIAWAVLLIEIPPSAPPNYPRPLPADGPRRDT